MNITCVCLVVVMICGGYWGYTEYGTLQNKITTLQSENSDLTESQGGGREKLAAERTQLQAERTKLQAEHDRLIACLIDASKTISTIRQICPFSATSLGNVSGPVTLPGTIITLDGKTYSQCVLLQAKPDGIALRHSAGVANIAYTDLDSSFAKAFSYDPIAGQKYEAQEAAKDASSDASVAAINRADQARLEAEAAAMPPPAPVVQVKPQNALASWGTRPQDDSDTNYHSAVYGDSSSGGYVSGKTQKQTQSTAATISK